MKGILRFLIFCLIFYGLYYVLIGRHTARTERELQQYYAISSRASEITSDFMETLTLPEQTEAEKRVYLRDLKEERRRIEDALRAIVMYQLEFEGDKPREYHYAGSFSNYDEVFEVTCENVTKAYAANLVPSYRNVFDLYVQEEKNMRLCKPGLEGAVYGEEDSYDGGNFPDVHHVRPHNVRGYQKPDGTYVNGYHRGGNSGYLRSNPDGNILNNLNK